MKHIKPTAFSWMTVVISVLVFFCAAPPAFCIKDVPRMSKEELKALLDNPDVVIIDARAPYDWGRSETRIKGALRLDPSTLDSWEPAYPKDKTIVVYCS
jgi:hypothetical protein